MIIVTGARGFVGRNLVEKLKQITKKKIVTVDFYEPHMNPLVLFDFLEHNGSQVEVIFHNGACSDTTESSLFHMMGRNTDYTIDLVRACIRYDIRLIYASSASVYGDGPYVETSDYRPKNLYATSKSVVDLYCSMLFGKTSQLVGLRYFNAYGKYEENKDHMASVVYKFFNQMKSGKIQLFNNSHNYKRDFIYIDDVVDMNLFFYDNPQYNGIYNIGTGVERSFLDIANIFLEKYDVEIEYIPMPVELVGKYQSYTRSDNSKISKICDHKYRTLEEGVLKYLSYLESS